LQNPHYYSFSIVFGEKKKITPSPHKTFQLSFSHAPKSHPTKWCKWGSKLTQLLKFLIVK